jgi:hypothetical protein
MLNVIKKRKKIDASLFKFTLTGPREEFAGTDRGCIP